jgi:hypothetical protein
MGGDTAIRDGQTSVYESDANTRFWLTYAPSTVESIRIVALEKVVGSSLVGHPFSFGRDEPDMRN